MPETERLPIQKSARTAATIYAKRLGILLGIAGSQLILLLVALQFHASGWSAVAVLVTFMLATAVFIYFLAAKRAPNLAYAAIAIVVVALLGGLLTYLVQYPWSADGSPTPVAVITPTGSPTTGPPTNTLMVYTATPTPILTDMATLTPTPMGVPPTNTPKPNPTKVRSTPTPRPPTNTPAPQFPWRGVPAGTFSNCGLTAYMGLTLDRSGGVAGDVVIHYWTDGWDGAWAVSEWVVDEGYPGEGDEKNWDGIINNHAMDGVWYACVVSQPGSWDCQSNRMEFTSVSNPCEPDSGGVQIFRVIFQQN